MCNVCQLLTQYTAASQRNTQLSHLDLFLYRFKVATGLIVGLKWEVLSICHNVALYLLLKKTLNHDSFCCQVSQVWFSERERIFTTAAMAGAAAFGAMIGM